MATGRDLQLTKQVGEYLIAAELCRRDLIATTFTGNVPHYDIIASDADGHHLEIQVKTIQSPNWQFDIRRFVDVQLENGKQILGKPIKSPFPHLIVILLVIKEYGRDQFYIMRWKDLQARLIRSYKKYLKQHGGRRPRKANSFHCSLAPAEVSIYEDNWDLLTQTIKSL